MIFILLVQSNTANGFVFCFCGWHWCKWGTGVMLIFMNSWAVEHRRYTLPTHRCRRYERLIPVTKEKAIWSKRTSVWWDGDHGLIIHKIESNIRFNEAMLGNCRYILISSWDFSQLCIDIQLGSSLWCAV